MINSSIPEWIDIKTNAQRKPPVTRVGFVWLITQPVPWRKGVALSEEGTMFGHETHLGRWISAFVRTLVIDDRVQDNTRGKTRYYEYKASDAFALWWHPLVATEAVLAVELVQEVAFH